ncbi:MAG: hypothetical protein Q7J54_06095 [Candidatus Woesearchaeota archaeon]|nr:hypothetical protein [Candidatus Woesearchaeota archaeon]
MQESTTKSKRNSDSDIGSLVSNVFSLNGIGDIGLRAPIKMWTFMCKSDRHLSPNRDLLIKYFGEPKVYRKDRLSKDMKKAIAILDRYCIFALHGQEVFGKKIEEKVMDVVVICNHGQNPSINGYAATYCIARIEDFNKYK